MFNIVSTTTQLPSYTWPFCLFSIDRIRIPPYDESFSEPNVISKPLQEQILCLHTFWLEKLLRSFTYKFHSCSWLSVTYLADESTNLNNVVVRDVDEHKYQDDELDDKNKIRFHINETNVVHS